MVTHLMNEYVNAQYASNIYGLPFTLLAMVRSRWLKTFAHITVLKELFIFGFLLKNTIKWMILAMYVHN